MTADIYPFDTGFLGRVAGRIVNEVRGITAVLNANESRLRGLVWVM